MEKINIKKPTLLLDSDKCKRNIRRLLDKLNNSETTFRPHFKTHQSKVVGQWFREEGVDKIAVSSVSMAQYFAEDGWKDILIAFPYNHLEINTIKDLANKVNLTLCIPCEASAKLFVEKCDFRVSVMIKVDAGYGRSGLSWEDRSGIVNTYNELSKNSLINITGLLTHAGDTYKAKSATEIERIFIDSVERLKSVKELLGNPELILSAGDTPSSSIIEDFSGINEYRPGNFVFFDLMQYKLGACSVDDIAVAVACPVVDINPKMKKVVIYGGGVHFSKDSIEVRGKQVFGLIVKESPGGWQPADDEIYLTGISQEHGLITYPDGIPNNIEIGGLIYVIPVHSCLTADLMREYQLCNGDKADHLNGCKK